MAKVFDIRLRPYEEELRAIIGGHEALQQELEEARRVFNTQFRKAMFMHIRPGIQDLLDLSARRGHWIEIHALMDPRYQVHLHQCYSIHFRRGTRADIAVVGNFDYRKVFVVVEYAGKTHQLDLEIGQIHQEPLVEWLMTLFPTL